MMTTESTSHSETNSPSYLQRVIQACINSVQTYESDTFSASGEAVTRPEAEAIVARLIRSRLFDADGTPGDIDGIALAEKLDDIRREYDPGFE